MKDLDFNKTDYYIDYFSRKPYWERNKEEEVEVYSNSLVFYNKKINTSCVIQYQNANDDTVCYIDFYVGENLCFGLGSDRLMFFLKIIGFVEDPINFYINAFNKLSEHLEIFKIDYEPILNDFGYYISLPSVSINEDSLEYFYLATYHNKNTQTNYLDSFIIGYDAVEDDLYLYPDNHYDEKLSILIQSIDDFRKKINNFIKNYSALFGLIQSIDDYIVKDK